MTDSELIADARQLIRHSSVSVPEHANMLGRLADALEAAEQRAEKAEGERDLFKREQVRLAARCDQAQNERDQLAAIVKKVLSHDPLHGADSGLHCGGMAPCIRDILTTAPADALREHDAKVRAEELREAYADVQAYTDSGAPFGHRPVEEFLLRRADRIEREAGE